MVAMTGPLGPGRVDHLLDRRAGKIESAEVLSTGQEQGGNEHGGDRCADLGYSLHRSSVV